MKMPTGITLVDWFAGVIASGLAQEVEVGDAAGRKRIAHDAYVQDHEV